ncbi:ABC transporter ATP-binding protein [Nigerium massiliense]|uniref:ABC transporter ATP-binding protein n=1 Tax=Nigerium massiliense TaxID=1522317 RepID=UPI00058C217E|nr:ABC transporter ATP-binding protein [Nigerium massiliense]
MRSLGRIVAAARELWPYYLGITLAAVVVAGTSLLTPFIISAATDEVVAQAQGHGRGLQTLVWLAVGVLAAELCNSVFTNVGGYLGDCMAVRLRSILSSRYFAKMLSLPQRYFDSQLTGTVINRLQRSITETTQFLQMFSNGFFPMVITLVATLVITASYSWVISLLLVIIYPVFAWLTALTSKRWLKLEQEKNHQLDIAGGRFAEAIGQIRVVKSFVQELRELRGFNDRYVTTTQLTSTQSRWWHTMDVARRAALNVVFFGIYLIIFLDTAQGRYSIGVMVLLIQLVGMAKQPVQSMSFYVDASQRAIAGSRSYFEAMEETPEPHTSITMDDALSFARDERRGEVALRDEASRPWPVVPGAPMIALDHVDFGYGDDEDVLHGITFDVAEGEHIALVGESGGGKTTLVNLLLGLYRPRGGTIAIQGTDIMTTPTTALRQETGVVFQDAALFSGTIRENIAYGRPDATDEQIEAVARRANVHQFVDKLADGYDTEIGERGIKLSGGQRQRIAVARAMLKDAPILVLDEATSALDSRSERLVQAGLRDLMNERTSVIIAHRLSTISSVDRIITLRDGRVDEIGSPAELATSGGIYAELLALQASASKADRKRLKEFEIRG